MKINLKYDHSNLSITNLHSLNIRSTKELEEVIEGISSCNDESKFFDFPVFIFIGFTASCRGLKIVVTVNEEGKYVTLDVKIPDPKEVLEKLCSLPK